MRRSLKVMYDNRSGTLFSPHVQKTRQASKGGDPLPCFATRHEYFARDLVHEFGMKEKRNNKAFCIV